MTIEIKNLQEGMNAWREEYPGLLSRGLVMPEVRGFLPTHFKENYKAALMAMDSQPGFSLEAVRATLLAMDAQPQLSTAPNSAIPAFMTNWVDPEVVTIKFAPNKIAEIFGEEKKGDWTTMDAYFPVVESTGETSAYDDYSDNGSSGANVNWPQRQSFLFQSFVEVGERELDMMGLAKLNWVSQQNIACALTMSKQENLYYAFGIQGLQLYGALNDPNLPASLTPAPKAYGGTAWIVGTVVKATANEIFTDIQSLVLALVNQSNSLLDADTDMTLVMPPALKMALTTTNAFNVNVYTLLKENFKNMKVETAVQYGGKTASNSQGNPAGNLIQLVAKAVQGQKVSTTAYNEKMRAHKIVFGASSWRQKFTGGVFGAVIKQPFAISSMLGC